MTTGFLENDGGKIAYEEVGSGPLAVCIPGMGDVRGEYRFLGPQLTAAGFRAVSLDVRGHGESSVGWADYSVAGVGSDVVALIRKLEAGPAFIIGTSMGGGAAVWAAAEIPELVRGLVLIDPFVRGAVQGLGRLLYRLLLSRPWGPALWPAYYGMLYPTRQPDDFREYRAALKANLAQPGRVEALLQMMLASKLASEQRLPAVKAPTLVVMGSRDPDFENPETEAQRAAQSLRGRYEMVSGAGHYPHAEMPEVTGPLVVSFLSSLTTGDSK